jgi:hypothetical protein
LSYAAGDLAAGFPLRRDLKGCLEFQAQNGRPARRRQAKSTALKKKRP